MKKGGKLMSPPFLLQCPKIRDADDEELHSNGLKAPCNKLSLAGFPACPTYAEGQIVRTGS